MCKQGPVTKERLTKNYARPYPLRGHVQEERFVDLFFRDGKNRENGGIFKLEKLNKIGYVIVIKAAVSLKFLHQFALGLQSPWHLPGHFCILLSIKCKIPFYPRTKER